MRDETTDNSRGTGREESKERERDSERGGGEKRQTEEREDAAVMEDRRSVEREIVGCFLPGERTYMYVVPGRRSSHLCKASAKAVRA